MLEFIRISGMFEFLGLPFVQKSRAYGLSTGQRLLKVQMHLIFWVLFCLMHSCVLAGLKAYSTLDECGQISLKHAVPLSVFILFQHLLCTLHCYIGIVCALGKAGLHTNILRRRKHCFKKTAVECVVWITLVLWCVVLFKGQCQSFFFC